MRRNGAADDVGEVRARRMGRRRGGPDPSHARRQGGGQGSGRRAPRLLRALAGGAIAAAVLATPVGPVQPRGTAAASAAPAMTVTPAAALADGGTVRATGTGLTGWPVLVQCDADPSAIADCDWATVTAL